MLNHEKLLDSINRLNNLPIDLTAADIVFSAPEVNVGNPILNTKIFLSAAKLPFINGAQFRYHRIDLQELEDIEISSNEVFTPQNVLAAINDTFQIELDPSDLFDIVVPVMDVNGDAANIPIAVMPDSVGWVGTSTALLAFNLPDASGLYSFFTNTLTDPEYV